MSIYCETTLNYARGEEQLAVPVRINNARDADEELCFEDAGFTLLHHESAIQDWHDKQALNEIHRGEAASLALDFIGCDQAIAYEPLVRSPQAASEMADHAPIQFVHSDYTDDYRDMVQSPERTYANFIGPLLAFHGLTHASLQNARRLAVLQFWRNIGATTPDYPIAFCDARTTPRSSLEKLLVEEYSGQRLEFETFYAKVPEKPESALWYTFPDMAADEVVAFRTYDSERAESGKPFWTLHSAFRDPNAGIDAPRRESIEMRVLCLWD